MNELATYFKELKRKYPKTMSKDQFYQVAHISKATALFLLQAGLVPCRDTGKKTRRYTIETDDVITYLKDRLVRPEHYKADAGWYKASSSVKNDLLTNRLIFCFSSEQEKKLAAFFLKKMQTYEDLLSVKQFAEFLGYDSTTVVNWCNKGHLKHFNVSGKFLIPKISAAEYSVSLTVSHGRKKSEKHQLLLQEFLTKK